MSTVFSTFADEAPVGHASKESKENYVVGSAATPPSYEKCEEGPRGNQIRSEIQAQVIEYEHNLVPKGRASAPVLSKLKAAREASRIKLYDMMARYDVSCFSGLASLDYLCPQLSTDQSIKTNEGLSYPLANGFKLLRTKEPRSGNYRATWTLRAPNGDTLALVADKDRNGFPDFVYLGGTWGNSASTSSRSVMGLDLDIEESSATLSGDKTIDLSSDARYSAMLSRDVQPLQSCLELGNPAALLSLVSDGEGWSPEKANLSFGKSFGYSMQGAWEGYQKGGRGLMKGVESGAVSLWEGFKGLGSILKTLGVGGKNYLTNAETRAKVHGGLAKAFDKAGDVYGRAWGECSSRGENIYASLLCMDWKVKKATGQGIGKMLQAMGAQIQKCWTGEGAEYGADEYFAECMGQIVFVTGSSAAGGAIYHVGSKVAVTGSSVAARSAGRGAAVMGEYVLDQTGVATMGKTAAGKLGSAVKPDLSQELKEITKGLRLDTRGHKAVEDYLQAYREAYGPELPEPARKHISNIAKNWAPDEIEGMTQTMSAVKRVVSDGPEFSKYVGQRAKLVDDQLRSLESSAGTHGTQEEFYASRLRQLQDEAKDLRNSTLDPVAARRAAARRELRYNGQSEEDIVQMLECFK